MKNRQPSPKAAARAIDRVLTKGENEHRVLKAAADLSPNDTSQDAAYLREVAGSIQDHRDSLRR
jgi:hypothetical protein